MKHLIVCILFLTILLACTSPLDEPVEEAGTGSYILALGDSYTIGSGVQPDQTFAWQATELLSSGEPDSGRDGAGPLDGNPYIIARLGWTTADLQRMVKDFEPTEPPRFVTLLIGVNNQFQSRPFGWYEQQFPALLHAALGFVQNDPNRVLVLSIPDYRYTPYGQDRNLEQTVSTEINQYNHFASQQARDAGVSFTDITELSRKGLQDPSLVADDGLHLSAAAYAEVSQRIAQWWTNPQ